MAALAVAGLVLSGCDLIVSPDRVLEGSGDTITITNGPFSSEFAQCTGDVDVFATVGDADPVLLGETTAVDGVWSLETPAPAERGSYTINAVCDDQPTVMDEELIVEPPFAPTVEPTQYVTGSGPEVITVAGDWCITSARAFEGDAVPVILDEAPEELPPGLPKPTVTAVLDAEELTTVALEHQPFGDSWMMEFAAPTTPGVHEVEITCTYFDFESGSISLPDIGPLAEPEAEAEPEPEIELLADEPLDLPENISLETVTSVVPIQVDGVLETDAQSFDEGDSVTVNNAASSPCHGVVTVRLTDGDTTVSKTPEVADDGSWTVAFDDLALGEPTVDAFCEGTQESDSFTYVPVVLSVTEGAAPSTSTTTSIVPPTGKVAAAAARPTAAQPAFTG